jgi:hypothetical protein
VEPIVTQQAPKDIFNLDKVGLFYNAQPKKTLALKGEKCQGGKGYKDGVTFLLCCNADGSEKLRPFIVGKFEKPRCSKGWKHYPSEYKSPKNGWMTGRLFREWLVTFDGKTTCQNRNVLRLMDQCAAHNSEGLTLKHVRHLYLPANTTSYMQPLDQGIIYEMSIPKASSVFLVERNRQGCSRRSTKIELGCHARCLHGMRIQHACSNSNLLCKM